MIIAEIGSVHDGSFGNAWKLIEAAAASGATAVKFQSHIADAETLPNAPMPHYFRGEPRLEYFRRTSFSPAQYRELMSVASGCGVEFVSSPFALEAVDMLEDLGLSIYKIPSGEVTNLPLLERVAATGRPCILSSGMSSWDELDAAVECLGTGGPLAIMQCSSLYPCPPDIVGLNVLAEMSKRYNNLPVGLSDHTSGLAAAIAAAAIGASIIEKHFAYSRLMYGSDARHSMEPAEFAQFAREIQDVWLMRESPVDKSSAADYSEMKRIFEKSLVAAEDLPAGTVIAREHLAFKKPGDGIGANRFREFIGRLLRQEVPRNHKFREDDFE